VQTLIQQKAEPQRKKRKARPDPPKLSDGKDPTVGYWILDMRNKLEADEEDYPEDRDQVAYCITRTEGKAAKHLGPRVGSSAKHPLSTADEVFDFLETVFQDRLTKKKARRQMSILKFSLGSSFHDFITDFRITAQEAEYDDDEWKELLDGALPDNMAQALAVQANDDGVDFEDFVEVCSRYALTAEQRRTKSSGRLPYSPAGGSTPSKKPSSGIEAPDQRARRSATPGARPKYDTAEKQKMSDEGRCFNCGETGHMARACPRPKKENPKKTRSQKEDKRDSEEDTAYESSGKEEP
jgi:Zinc knuckle